MEKLFNAIKNQDKEDIKDIFSQKAINEVENIDKEIDSLLSFVRGYVALWKFDSFGWCSGPINYGQEQKMIRPWFYLTTDKYRYKVHFFAYPIDELNSENEGVNTIIFFREEMDVRKSLKNFCFKN